MQEKRENVPRERMRARGKAMVVVGRSDGVKLFANEKLGQRTLDCWGSTRPNKRFTLSNMSGLQDYLLPGQPIHIDPSNIPQLGNGLYARAGDVRASLFGPPQLNRSVRFLFLLPLPPMRSNEAPWLDFIY